MNDEQGAKPLGRDAARSDSRRDSYGEAIGTLFDNDQAVPLGASRTMIARDRTAPVRTGIRGRQRHIVSTGARLFHRIGSPRGRR